MLVLFGFRPSVVSIIRNTFIPTEDTPLPLEQLATALTGARSAPCYLILSSGTSTTVIEKDLLDGKLRNASDFIVHTNHDIKITDTADPTPAQKEKSTILGMEAFLEESEDRHNCIQEKWNKLVQRQERQRRKMGEGKEGDSVRTMVTEKTLQRWVNSYPIMNECSHFGCIMDPASGTIRWLERGVPEEDVDEDFNVSKL
jgi:hypothetical protein